MNIKRFNGNDFPGDKWVRDILTRVNEIIDYLKQNARTQSAPTSQTSTTIDLSQLSDAVLAKLTPAGGISAFGGSTAPTGYLLCDGSEVSQSAYPELYAAIGSTWNTCTNPLTGSAYSAPASGKFRLPDLRGAFIRGVGTFSDGIGTNTTLAGYQGDQFQGHYHRFNSYQAAHPRGAGEVTEEIGNNPATTIVDTRVRQAITDGTNGTPRTGTETRPRNVGVNYIIKT